MGAENDSSKADYCNNPYTKNLIYGIRLKAGTILEATDVYASTSGKWELCPCPGLILGMTHTIWVRPVAE